MNTLKTIMPYEHYGFYYHYTVYTDARVLNACRKTSNDG